MLHMPDAVAEEITGSYSKQEVQAIKEEIDAEHAVSDIEVAIEAAEAPEPEGASWSGPSASWGRSSRPCTTGCMISMP